MYFASGRECSDTRRRRRFGALVFGGDCRSLALWREGKPAGCGRPPSEGAFDGTTLKAISIEPGKVPVHYGAQTFVDSEAG